MVRVMLLIVLLKPVARALHVLHRVMPRVRAL